MDDPLDPLVAQRVNAEQAKRERQLREQKRVVLRKVLSSENGRTFVMDLIAEGRLFQISMDLDQSEKTHLTSFRDGRKSVAAELALEVVTSCPELWNTMLRERADRLRDAT